MTTKKYDTTTDRDLIRTTQSRLRLTNSEVADYLGVTTHTVYKWKTGDRRISAPTLKLIEVLHQLEMFYPEVHKQFLPEFKALRK